MDLYFQRHDGSAVTCDDFLAAMADANGEDLTDLSKWYGQAGTPVVKAKGTYDAASKTYTLSLAQSCPATPSQDTKVPVLIPVRVALLGADGKPIAAHASAESAEAREDEVVLRLTRRLAGLRVFEGVASRARPVPAAAGFSAPVKLEIENQTDENLEFILAQRHRPLQPLGGRPDPRPQAGRRPLRRRHQGRPARSATRPSRGPQRDAGGVSNSLVEAFRSLLNARGLGRPVPRLRHRPAQHVRARRRHPPGRPGRACTTSGAIIVKEIAQLPQAGPRGRHRRERGRPRRARGPSPRRPAPGGRSRTGRIGYLATLKDDAITESIFDRFKERHQHDGRDLPPSAPSTLPAARGGTRRWTCSSPSGSPSRSSCSSGWASRPAPTSKATSSTMKQPHGATRRATTPRTPTTTTRYASCLTRVYVSDFARHAPRRFFHDPILTCVIALPTTTVLRWLCLVCRQLPCRRRLGLPVPGRRHHQARRHQPPGRRPPGQPVHRLQAVRRGQAGS